MDYSEEAKKLMPPFNCKVCQSPVERKPSARQSEDARKEAIAFGKASGIFDRGRCGGEYVIDSAPCCY
jgi:hypothetical protein